MLYKTVPHTSALNEEKTSIRYYQHNSSMSDFLLRKSIPNTNTLEGYPESQGLASLGDVQWRLSGGAANFDPYLSLGGVMSTAQVYSQDIKSMEDTPGITIVRGSSNERGVGTLYVLLDEYGRRWVDWKPSGGTEGGAVQVLGSGRYTLLAGRGTQYGYLSVDIDVAELSEAEVSYSVFVDNGYQEIFPAVTASEAEAGIEDYRCIYLYNSSSKGAFRDLYFYLKQDTDSNTDISMGFQPEGINFEPPVVGSRSTAPAGVVFTQPDASDPLQPPDVVWGRRLSLWLKRVVPAGSYDKVVHDLSIISYGVKF